MGVDPTGPALALVIVIGVGLALTTPTIVLRFYARIKSQQLGLDDWLMGIGFLVSIFDKVASLIAVHHGVGAHAYRLSEYDQSQGRKWFLFAAMSYTTSTAPIKASICILLLRITSGIKRVYAYILYSVIVITTGSMIIRLVFWATRCQPFAAAWDPTLGKCQSATALINVTYFFSAICILTDWVCAIIPVFVLWNVQRSLRSRVHIALILALGVLASIATCVRFKYVMSYSNPNDYLYGLANMGTWSGVETALGIIAGSLPALRPLLRRLPFFSSSTTATRKTTKDRDLSHKLRYLRSSRRDRSRSVSAGADDVTYMGHAFYVNGGKDVERGDPDETASQTHILGEDRLDILMEVHVDVKSERHTESGDSGRRDGS